MCLAQGPQRSDAGETLTCGPLGLESSPIPLSHCAPSKYKVTGRVAQLVTYLTTYACLSANLGLASSTPSGPKLFTEIDHEIICLVILLPSADSKRVVVSYKRKYAHEVLVNHLVKLAQEKSMVR